jgi:hypothetical protein
MERSPSKCRSGKRWDNNKNKLPIFDVFKHKEKFLSKPLKPKRLSINYMRHKGFLILHFSSKKAELLKSWPFSSNAAHIRVKAN